MGNVIQNIVATTTTTADELQVRNGQDHQRVYDPDANATLKEILAELRSMNRHLEIITELEVNDWD